MVKNRSKALVMGAISFSKRCISFGSDRLEVYKTYCTGCGLCGSERGIHFTNDEQGFPQAMISAEDVKLCKRICPASGCLWELQKGEIWGDYKKVFLGWSQDEEIRKKASSGGTITTLCIYLLEHGGIDGIIHTRKSKRIPYATETVISKNREDILKGMGSRYSISSPLLNIRQIPKGKRYCFVGKPCDVYALRSLMQIDNSIADLIPISISFFCAGMPSVNAQRKLLEKLECSEADCYDLQYRGNGWPGYATAIHSDGKQKSITYAESWGSILGRNVRYCCRFCLDGVGTFADIACGDAWYLKNGQPDFTEADGRNVIFARSEIGYSIILDADEKKYLHIEDYANGIDELKMIQPYQYDRKSTMNAMLMAAKLCGRPIPYYPIHILKNYASYANIKTKGKRFVGTLRRIIKHKI